jgi:hypothetical protein
MHAIFERYNYRPMINATISATDKHLEFLHEGIFKTKTKWPHFNRLLEDMVSLGAKVKPDETVAILERSYVYGGDSLFAPLISKCDLILIDCQTLTASDRGAYQKHWTDDERCIHITSQIKAPITDTGLKTASVDLLIVPNVVHHERDQDAMFAEFSRIMKKGARGYIFEALLRELHQMPDDYVRYTPWGFEYMFEKHGLKLSEYTPVGGPFEAITYCWDQALQYIPDDEKVELKSWFWDKHYAELLELDRKYTKNLKRMHTSFPLGYGIYFEKP